jgi:PEP-CTERM motif
MKPTLAVSKKRSLSRLLAKTFALVALVFAFACSPHADGLSYNVSIDTSYLVSPIAAGSYLIDLQFNPGQLPGTQLAFAGATVPDCCNIDGVGLIGDTSDDAVGGPPSFINFDNQSALNEGVIQLDIVPNTPITFGFNISGPAVDTPNGTSRSGTTFSIGLFDPYFDPILTSDGVIGLVNLNLNGFGTVQTFSPAITITDLNPPPPPPVPEPSTLILLTTGLTGTVVLIRRKSSHSATPRVTNISL